MPPRDAGSPDRILVRLPNWVGDAVMATPALRALRGAHPGAEIVAEGRPAIGELLRGLPHFDVFWPDPGTGIGWARARAHRAGRFDWAVLLPDSPRAALAPFVARTPRRIGYARDRLRRALLTDALDPPSENGRRVPVPMAERYLRVTRHLGCPDRGGELELAVHADAAARVDKELAGRGVASGDDLLVVAPGASFGSSKLWPAAHFATACDGIARRLGLLPVLAPAPGEEPLAAEVTARMSERSLCLIDPPLGIAELAALVARAALVLSNDTGPRHVAVALGRPVVVTMGPTDPRHTDASLGRQRVLREPVECSPCHLETCPIDHRCLERLAPDRVLAAAEELLAP